MPTGTPNSGTRKKMRQRRIFSDAVKQKAIAEVLGGETKSAVAEKVGTGYSVVHSWVKKHKAAGLNGSAVLEVGDLPSVQTPMMTKRLKKLLATQFSCPHCGGPVALS